MVRPSVAAVERLERSSGAIWLVQSNPRISNILADVALVGMPARACVKRYVSDIRGGDRIVFWLSGARAGVYALGEVGEDGVPSSASSGGATERSSREQVELNLFVDLFAQPVLRTVLKVDPRFCGESIIRQPFGANPHRVSAPAFDAILEHIALAP